MKNLLKATFSLALIFTFCISGSASAKAIKLTYSNFFPGKHIQSVLAQEWCDEVEKRTDGKIKVQYFPGGTLTKSTQVYDGVVNGLSDLGTALFAYTRGRFPVMEAVDLPVGYTSGVQATKVVNHVYNKLNPKELQDTRVMFLHAHGPGLLNTSDKPVRKLEDMKGMKLRGHGTTAQVIKFLGGTTVSMPMPELYQSLQKGIVKGAMYPIEVNKGWRMGEVTKYITKTYSIAYTSSFYLVMNKRKWNKIPADLQKIIMDLNREMTPKHGEAWDESDKAGLEYVKGLGHEIINLSDEEQKRWQKAIAPVIDDYATKMDKKGYDGKAIVKLVKDTVAMYK